MTKQYPHLQESLNSITEDTATDTIGQVTTMTEEEEIIKVITKISIIEILKAYITAEAEDFQNHCQQGTANFACHTMYQYHISSFYFSHHCCLL